jgi:hypothetical protein
MHVPPAQQIPPFAPHPWQLPPVQIVFAFVHCVLFP